jgi:hypothetical protein
MRPSRQGAKQISKNSEMKNSDVVYFNEYLSILKRKEYTAKEVERYFNKLGKLDRKTYCHHCGKRLNRLMVKVVKRCFCHFCMEYVCSSNCLSYEEFIIPRNFYLDYDLKKRQVCH